MNLPVPTDAEVAEFKEIYDRQCGTNLTPDEAREAATLVLQLFYLGTYGVLHLQPKTRADPADLLPKPQKRGNRKPHGSHSSPGK